MKNTLRMAASTLAVLLSSATFSMAQDDAMKGYNAGNFTFKPSVAVSESYDDNIYTEANHENSDFITTITPKLTVDANTAKPNKLQFNVGAAQKLFADNSDDNRLDYNAGVIAKTQLSDLLTWDGSADFRHLHNDRGDNETDPTATASEPPAYDVIRAATSLTVQQGSIAFKPRLGLTDYNYKDYSLINATKVDQDFRDRTEYVVGGRLSYDIGQNIGLFIDGETNPRNYDQSSATERTSDGGTYLAGLTYKADNGLKAEAGLGYMNRDYDRNVYKDIDTTAAQASLQWYFEPGSSVRASYNRAIGETTQTNVGGTLNDAFKVSLIKKLTDDVSGSLDAKYTNVDYQGGRGATGGTSDRHDKIFGLGAGLEYKLDEKISFTADYDYVNNNSNLNTAEYNKNVFMLGVKYAF